MNPFKGQASTGGTGGSDADYEVPDADTHYGTLVAVIDIGTHTTTYQNETSTYRRCVLVWELDCKRSDGDNHFLAKEYRLSFDAKAALRKALEACRRKNYADGEAIEIDRAIGSKWSIVVKHQQKVKDGKPRTYAKIDSVGPVKKGATVPAPTVQPFFWHIGCGDQPPTHGWLPRLFGNRISDLITISPEWGALTHPAGQQPAQANQVQQPQREEQGSLPAMAGAFDDTPF